MGGPPQVYAWVHKEGEPIIWGLSYGGWVEMIKQREEQQQCRSPSLPDLILPPLLAVASSIRTRWNPALTSLWAAAMPDIPHPMTTISGSALAAMSPRVTQAVPLSQIWSLTQDQCEVIWYKTDDRYRTGFTSDGYFRCTRTDFDPAPWKVPWGRCCYSRSRGRMSRTNISNAQFM